MSPTLRYRVFTWMAVGVHLGSACQGSVYLDSVKPALMERCAACHGALKQKAGLRVDTAAAMADAGILESGELWRRLTTEDLEERMPPEGDPLEPDALEAIRAWIDQGAPVPDDERAEADPRDHWAFQPIRSPTVPETDARHPIDAFLSRVQETLQTKPTERADPLLLRRRLYLDLTGLAPTEAELDADEPYETTVDRLLASPRYGERWGRHWMDVWRYSDEYGLGAQLRFSQKHLWHWRDWIIESLNQDKGYDQMALEMLAGDEIAPNDPKTYRATGFLARNYYLFNRTTWLDNTIESVSKAFLGLTMNCAKCHDHKYDPIEQTDYYRFRAFFEPHQVRLDPVPRAVDFDKAGLPRVYDADLDAPTYLHRRGAPSQADTNHVLHPAPPAFFPYDAPPIQTRDLPTDAWAPGTRDYFQEATIAAIEARRDPLDASDTMVAKARRRELDAELASVRARIAADQAAFHGDGSIEETAQTAERAQREWELARARRRVAELESAEERDASALEKARASEAQWLAVLGEPLSGAYAPLRGSRKALETPEHKEPDYPATYPRQTSGRRHALALWIIDSRNPLTARVAVNHIWMRHFGTPLVASVTDFGRRAPAPLHAELLDYLASEFIASGWRMKALHRLIVTSEAYRRRSTAQGYEGSRTRDPENQSYWRGTTRRLDAQILRDNLLHLANQLDPTIGGPSLAIDRPSQRRSLYFRHSRDDVHPVLTLFDDADIFACYRRSESVTPQQALALSNSALAFDAAEAVAESFATAGDEGFVRRLWRGLLCREIDPAELAACVSALEAWRALYESASPNERERRARARLTHTLINHNDFITIR